MDPKQISILAPGISEEEAQLIDPETFRLEDRRLKVSLLRAQKKKTFRQIAEEVGCSFATACRDYKIVTSNFAARFSQAREAILAEEIIRLEYLELEFQTEWDRSKGEHTESTAEMGGRGKDGDERRRSVLRKKQRFGDARLGKLMLEALRMRCELLGLTTSAKANTNELPPVKLVAGIDPAELV